MHTGRRYDHRTCSLGFLGLLLFFAAPARAQYSILYDFGSGGNTDAAVPQGSLILSGSTLYGMTQEGGNSGGFGDGTVFSISTSGGSDTILHSFGSGTDGVYPYGSLVMSLSTLYGMTQKGGSNSDGTIFSISTSGGSDTILHSFAGGASDGSSPVGSLILSANGATLYGMTPKGGVHSDGTIFSIPFSGGSINILHSFAGGTLDGSDPSGSLIRSGSILYGMTSQGGSSSAGTVFSLNTSSNTETILYSFGGVADGDGQSPQGSLILSGSTLYGMTQEGGSNGDGTIFSVPTSGGSDTILHSFSTSATDGARPNGSLILSGSTLYGMTADGGSNGDGAIFSFDLNTDTYTDLYSFGSVTDDGLFPNGDPILVGNTLYGMAVAGGTDSDGVIFSLVVPEPSTLFLLSVGALGLLARRRPLGDRA
jgi:uncharacterized repeat protein (TIGR03803 family)